MAYIDPTAKAAVRRRKIPSGLTIAVDFDGTLCEGAYPGIGRPKEAVIKTVKMLGKSNRLVLWTCREGQDLEMAISWCRSHGIEFDAVNSNTREMLERWDYDTRKIGADMYIDDKAIAPAELVARYGYD